MAVAEAMDELARGASADRSGFDRLAGDLAHPSKVVIRRRLQVHATLAHHIDAQRAVRDLSGEVDVDLALAEGVQIFGKGFPAPRRTSLTTSGMSSTYSINLIAGFLTGAKPTPKFPTWFAIARANLKACTRSAKSRSSEKVLNWILGGASGLDEAKATAPRLNGCKIAGLMPKAF
jgi:hypothetical protein